MFEQIWNFAPGSRVQGLSRSLPEQDSTRPVGAGNLHQPSSFLKRSWKTASRVISYITTHPLQTITTGLAAQSVTVAAFEPVMSLSTLNGQNGFVLTGVAAGDSADSSQTVGTVGDVNGDGIADLIIGASRANGGVCTGYVVFGHTSTWNTPWSLSTLNGANGLMLSSTVQGNTDGISVGTAGDVNGDGIADLIIGFPEANGGSGTSYVVFGHTGAWNTPWSLSTLNGVNGFVLTGPNTQGASGYSVGTAGDVNGDGIADLIIGAHRTNDWRGASYVVFGHTGTWTTPFSLSTLNGVNGFVLTGLNSQDASGISVGAAGDLNGDGIADLIIGAYHANNGLGAAYIVFGHTGVWTTPFSLASLNGFNGVELAGFLNNPGRGLNWAVGWSVGVAGDVNGDGITDVVMGAPNTDTVYVVFGHTGVWTTPFSLANLDGTNGFELIGISDQRTGYSVGTAGDINGDGIADLIIGAPYVNNYAGASYVVFGHRDKWMTPLSLNSLDGENGFVLTGVNSRDFSGVSVGTAADVNGDRVADLIIHASGANNGAGVNYVVFGSTTISKTSTLSPSATIKASTTASLSVSQTSSSSTSGTCTISMTPSLTPSVSTSLSPTPTSSITCSDSPTVTSSMTPSVTVSVSGTRSSTGSNTLPPSETPSISPSITPTSSVTASVTPSESGSVTPSSTLTPSQTVSPSSSVTMTPTLTATSSITPSVSSTATPTLTPTASVTPSVTSSGTASVSRSESATVSSTLTPSGTITASPSSTPTSSITASNTVSSSGSVTASQTLSPSNSVTATSTITPTASITSSDSPTATPSMTSSVTASVSETRSATGSNTLTPSRTITASPSSTLTSVEFKVDANGNYPAVATLSNGNFLITWNRDNDNKCSNSIYGRLYDPQGLPVDTSFSVSRNSLCVKAKASYSKIATFQTGGFAVIWWNDQASDIYAQRYNATAFPIGNIFEVNAYNYLGNQLDARVAAFDNGDFMVVWSGNRPGDSGWNVYAKHYNATGFPIQNDFMINTVQVGNQDNPCIGVLRSQNFVIAWRSHASANGIYARYYNTTGIPIGNEFRISLDNGSNPADPQIAALSNGGFVVVWWTEPDQVYGRLYDANGFVLGAPFNMNSNNDAGLRASVAAFREGGFVSIWEGAQLLYGQSFDNQGLTLESPWTISKIPNNHAFDSDVTILSHNAVVVVWGDGSNVYARLYGSNVNPSPDVSSQDHGHSNTSTTFIGVGVGGAASLMFLSAIAHRALKRHRARALEPSRSNIARVVTPDNLSVIELPHLRASSSMTFISMPSQLSIDHLGEDSQCVQRTDRTGISEVVAPIQATSLGHKSFDSDDQSDLNFLTAYSMHQNASNMNRHDQAVLEDRNLSVRP